MILVEIEAAGILGLGYTYADACLTELIAKSLAQVLLHRDSLDIVGLHAELQRHVRNLGRSGLAACAISALDAALWDVKAKHLGLPLCLLLGSVRERVPVYGSGGFTTYDDERLRSQLAGWVAEGCSFVKIKIGSEPSRDPARAAVARDAIGKAQLFVDANGAFTPDGAKAMAAQLAGLGVTWFEEPVTSDDLAGLHIFRTGAPPGMSVAAGEYISTLDDARRLLEAGAVDVLQADATRCGGVTGFLAVAALADSQHIYVSGHCAPALHRHLACATPRLRHLEWFHDHARIEQMFFDGAPRVNAGCIAPDVRENGQGLVFRSRDAEKFLVSEAST